jgi:hypothetical protein
MKIVKVVYTTSADYAAQNKENIQAVMQSLHALGNKGINYHVCLAPDGKTFTHTAFFQTDEDQKALFNLETFQHFQTQLKQSHPESAPAQELLTLVGTSKELFS